VLKVKGNRIMADETEDNGTYTVGYRKPPLHTRFRKGESRKRAPRVKPPETMREMIERIGAEPLPAQKGGRRITRAQAVALTTRRLAAQGDVKAIQDMTRIGVLLGHFDEKGRYTESAGYMYVPSTPQTEEEIAIHLIELEDRQAQYRERRPPAGPADASPGTTTGPNPAPAAANASPSSNGPPKPVR
jgi:hypothetical protein